MNRVESILIKWIIDPFIGIFIKSFTFSKRTRITLVSCGILSMLIGFSISSLFWVPLLAFGSFAIGIALIPLIK
jgi:hypothetical protein